jgi:hypothetical protein
VLATVPGYRREPVYEAAQAVQHSADGYAYMTYQRLAAQLAAAFTGRAAHAVWCWPAGPAQGRAKLAAARGQLVRIFGPLPAALARPPRAAPALLVRPGPARLSWAVAEWLVTHAASYRIHVVRYAGMQWRAAAGHAGWVPGNHAATAGQIQAS